MTEHTELLDQIRVLLQPILDQFMRTAPSISLFAIAIFVYAFVVWYFYRNLAKRDVFRLNLSRYEKRVSKKIFSVFSYFLKYLIVFPIYTFIWFAVLATFLFLLAKSQSVANVLLIAIAIVGAARIGAYYNQDMSQEIAKLVPYSVLGVALVQPNFFSIDLAIQRFTELQGFLEQLPVFVLFIIVLEVVLKVLLSMKHLVLGEKKKVDVETVAKESAKDMLFLLKTQKQLIEKIDDLELKLQDKHPEDHPKVEEIT